MCLINQYLHNQKYGVVMSSTTTRNNPKNILDIFSPEDLLSMVTKEDGRKIMTALRRNPSLALWEYFGKVRNNAGPLRINHKPEYPLGERVMNAIDAMIQPLYVTGQLGGYTNPQDVAKDFFESEDMSVEPKDRPVQVCFMGDWDPNADTVTLDIRDFGIGILNENILSKILSLHNGGKANIVVLAGKFGHGGSQTFSFSHGISMIVTRHRSSDEVSFAFVVCLRPGDFNPKEGGKQKHISSYMTLVDPATGKPFTTSAYDSDGNEIFKPGTLIRHFEYELDQRDLTFKKNPGPQKSSLYKTMNQVFPEVIIPFSIFDKRSGKRGRGEREAVVYGGKRTLDLDPNNHVEYKNSATIPLGKNGGKMKIYWYVLNDKATQSKYGQNFVNHGYSGSIMLSGQNVENLPSSIIRKEAKLPFLEKSIILFADLDTLDDRTLDDIGTSTRQAIKNSYFESICDYFAQHLEVDSTLKSIHDRRKKSVSSSQVNLSINKKIQDYFSSHMTGSMARKKYQRKQNVVPGEDQKPTPIQLLDKATFIQVKSKNRALEAGSSFCVKFETDAKPHLFPANFKVTPIGSSASLVDVSKFSVTDDKDKKSQGYKNLVNLKVSSKAEIGDNFGLELSLDNGHGEILKDSVYCKVIKREKSVVKTEKVPEFNVIWFDENATSTIDLLDFQDQNGNLFRDKVGVLMVEGSEYTLYLAKFNEQVQQGLDVLEDNISRIGGRYEEYEKYFLQEYLSFQLGIAACSYAIIDDKDTQHSESNEEDTEFDTVLRNTTRGLVAFWESNFFTLVG